jgi:hypothetical protein
MVLMPALHRVLSLAAAASRIDAAVRAGDCWVVATRVEASSSPILFSTRVKQWLHAALRDEVTRLQERTGKWTSAVVLIIKHQFFPLTQGSS